MRNSYERALKRALARLETGLDLRWQPPPSRDELYGRLALQPPRRQDEGGEERNAEHHAVHAHQDEHLEANAETRVTVDPPQRHE